MGAMASQITSLTIVYSTVYSDADQSKHQSSASLAFVRWTGEFPAEMASNAENVSIWWRHHVLYWAASYIKAIVPCIPTQNLQYQPANCRPFPLHRICSRHYICYFAPVSKPWRHNIGNAFRITGPWWEKWISHGCISFTPVNNAAFWCLLVRTNSGINGWNASGFRRHGFYQT